MTLEPGTPAELPVPDGRSLVEVGRLGDPVPVALSEPNVLLLDRAEFRLDDGPWETEQEVLRLDNALRKRLGWPLRMDALAQPWTDPHAPADRTLRLRFRFRSDVPVEGALLALEDARHATIHLNGQPVPSEVSGWWVDEDILTVPLPPLLPGEHAIELTTPYGRQSNPEYCYLLGDFGVEVRGQRVKLTAPVRDLAFGDWTRQGLPFYAGNVTYRCALEGDGSALTLEASRFRAPLLSVALDGWEVGKVAFAPYRIDLGAPSAGPHQLDVTAYGNRVNAFGPLHNADESALWFGPDAWRTEGPEWSDEYQLRPAGVITAPRLLARADHSAKAKENG